MLKKSPKGYYYLDKFNEQKGLVHGFSSRRFGDCSPEGESTNWRNIEEFLSSMGLKTDNLVIMEQVHGNRIKVVGGKNKGKTIPGVDGLVTSVKGVILGVRSADCLPVLYYDPVGEIIGAAHAGWRGVIKELSQKMIDIMIRLGSVPENILVGIGPYIGECCYNIDVQREKKFKRKFGDLEGMIVKRGEKTYLDLVVPSVIQLVHTGVLKKKIISPSVCTSCQNKEFFSYRKDAKETYGEMLGVISLLPECQKYSVPGTET